MQDRTAIYDNDKRVIMNKQKSQYFIAGKILTEESGFVLITALMFMVILAIMGVASMSIRNTEQTVTQNAEIFQNNFYAVEAVTLEGATKIDAAPDATLKDVAAFPGWLKVKNPATINLNLSAQWPGVVIPADTSLNGGVTNITPPGYVSNGTAAGDRIWYAAVDLGACGGSVTDPTKVEKCYDIYGMYDVKPGAGKSYHGKMMLAVGYKRVVYLD